MREKDERGGAARQRGAECDRVGGPQRALTGPHALAGPHTLTGPHVLRAGPHACARSRTPDGRARKDARAMACPKAAARAARPRPEQQPPLSVGHRRPWPSRRGRGSRPLRRSPNGAPAGSCAERSPVGRRSASPWGSARPAQATTAIECSAAQGRGRLVGADWVSADPSIVQRRGRLVRADCPPHSTHHTPKTRCKPGQPPAAAHRSRRQSDGRRKA